MKKSRLLGAVCASLTIASISANATVLNTLNGVNYEWLELSATQLLSRNTVEARIIDPTDDLFGYEYASRSLVEDLLLSYTAWDGLDGWHGAATVTSGVESFLSDFAILKSTPLTPGTTTTEDGGTIPYDLNNGSLFLYGHTGECGEGVTSRGSAAVLYNETVLTGAFQGGRFGWDHTNTNPTRVSYVEQNSDLGSLLVKTSTVPIPAALWLFVTGLMGLVGISRHKKLA